MDISMYIPSIGSINTIMLVQSTAAARWKKGVKKRQRTKEVLTWGRRLDRMMKRVIFGF